MARSRRPAAGAYALPELVPYRYPHSGIGLVWVWIAVPAGAAFGAVGVLWRRGGRWAPIAAAVPVAAFLGEAAIWFGRERPGAFTLEVCAAAALVAVLVPRASQRLAATAIAGAMAGAAVAMELAVYLSVGYLVE